MTEIYSFSEEYVDIYGHKLNVMVRSDGAVFIPLNDIRKTGFHVFPKSEYTKSSVGTHVMNELRLYLLGAAKEFLIQKDVHFIKNEEISKSIEECCTTLTGNGDPSHNNSTTSGVLGRTLLRNPIELSKAVRTPPPPVAQKFDNTPNTYQNRRNPKGSDSLRMPHQNDSPKYSDNSFKNQQNFSNKSKYQNHKDHNEQNRNFQSNNMNQTNSSYRTMSDSRSNSENEESTQYIKLSNLSLKRIELETEMQDVKIVHVETNNEKLKYWIQLVENDKIVLDIMEKCMMLADDSPVVQPKLDTIYFAQDVEGIWNRAIVTRVNPKVKVHFLDFGNDALVHEVRSIPTDLASIPAQAVRIVLSRPEASSQTEIFGVDDVLTVKKLKQFVDTTFLVQKGDKKKNTLPRQNTQEPVMMNEIKYSTNLLNKDTVKIISHLDGKLYLRNKDHHEKLVEVDLEVKKCTRQAVNMIGPGQLVLSKKEGCEEKLCRAIVKKSENNLVNIHFIDYHKDEKVPAKNLFYADKAIASMPATLIVVPLKGYSIDKFDANAASMLEEYIMNNVKFTVEKSGSEIDLRLKDKSLSEILFPFKSSAQSSPQKKESVQSTNALNKSDVPYKRIMFDDIKCYEAPMGKGDYMLTNYKDPTDFTVTSTGDLESDLLSQCTGINVTDTEPYYPEETEMVLAFFEDFWYRGLVLDKIDNERYHILFVEYGNMAELSVENIRRFPKEYIDIPILGLACTIKVPCSEAVKNRLEQLLEPDNIYEINFLSYSIETLQYTVDIPKITELLKQEGLI